MHLTDDFNVRELGSFYVQMVQRRREESALLLLLLFFVFFQKTLGFFFNVIGYFYSSRYYTSRLKRLRRLIGPHDFIVCRIKTAIFGRKGPPLVHLLLTNGTINKRESSN